MKKDFFLNGFVVIVIVGMVLSVCMDNELDYGLGIEVKGEYVIVLLVIVFGNIMNVLFIFEMLDKGIVFIVNNGFVNDGVI